MELICKHFSELTASELYEIYRLRVSVFVVEQNCAYQDVDEADRTAWHIWLQDEGGIAAYARVLAPGTVFPDVSIGRVTAVRRREGWGAGSSSPPSAPRRSISARGASPSRRRATLRPSIPPSASPRPGRNFSRTASRMSPCSCSSERYTKGVPI